MYSIGRYSSYKPYSVLRIQGPGFFDPWIRIQDLGWKKIRIQDPDGKKPDLGAETRDLG